MAKHWLAAGATCGMLWLITPSAFAAYGALEAAGLCLVIGAVLLASYALTASLRLLSLARDEAREPDNRQRARRLLALDLVSALGLAVESVRLQDRFWLYCGGVCACLGLCLLWRTRPLRARRASSHGWRSVRSQLHERESWPEITVTSTAPLLRSTARAGASISVNLGSRG